VEERCGRVCGDGRCAHRRGGVWQLESDGGQVLVGGVAVDAVAPYTGLDGDVAPEAIQARAYSRRACLRIRCRRDCMLERYAQRGDPARVYGVKGPRLDAGSAAATADERASACLLNAVRTYSGKGMRLRYVDLEEPCPGLGTAFAILRDVGFRWRALASGTAYEGVRRLQAV
jgi:hypothetical protein